MDKNEYDKKVAELEERILNELSDAIEELKKEQVKIPPEPIKTKYCNLYGYGGSDWDPEEDKWKIYVRSPYNRQWENKFHFGAFSPLSDAMFVAGKIDDLFARIIEIAD